MKGLKTIGLLVLLLSIFSVFGAALNLGDVISVDAEVDGDSISEADTNRVSFERGDLIDVEVRMTSTIDLDNVELLAMISGYEFNNVEPMSDSSTIFDMDANVTYKKKLSIRVPVEVEEDDYKLRLVLSNRYDNSETYDYKLRLDSARHGFQIEDVVFSPGNVVEAGRALLTTVRVENKGQNDEESVKVTVAIPALGVSASDFIDEIKFDDSETTEEMYLRIPTCAKAGDYNAVIEVKYNELREALYENAVITVVEGDSCVVASEDNEQQTQPKTVIAIGATSQNLVVGEAGALYPLTITNNGKSSAAYTVSVEGSNDFASVQVNPVSSFVLGKGDSQAVYIYMTPLANAASGQRIFTVTVKSGNEVVKQLPMTANVQASEKKSGVSSNMDVRDALEIGLIVLIVLVIILAIIVAVKKMKKDDNEGNDEDEVEGKTYY
jgi:uncharacterized membrane protein